MYKLYKVFVYHICTRCQTKAINNSQFIFFLPLMPTIINNGQSYINASFWAIDCFFIDTKLQFFLKRNFFHYIGHTDSINLGTIWFNDDDNARCLKFQQLNKQINKQWIDKRIHFLLFSSVCYRIEIDILNCCHQSHVDLCSLNQGQISQSNMHRYILMHLSWNFKIIHLSQSLLEIRLYISVEFCLYIMFRIVCVFQTIQWIIEFSMLF